VAKPRDAPRTERRLRHRIARVLAGRRLHAETPRLGREPGAKAPLQPAQPHEVGVGTKAVEKRGGLLRRRVEHRVVHQHAVTGTRAIHAEGVVRMPAARHANPFERRVHRGPTAEQPLQSAEARRRRRVHVDERHARGVQHERAVAVARHHRLVAITQVADDLLAQRLTRAVQIRVADDAAGKPRGHVGDAPASQLECLRRAFLRPAPKLQGEGLAVAAGGRTLGPRPEPGYQHLDGAYQRWDGPARPLGSSTASLSGPARRTAILRSSGETVGRPSGRNLRPGRFAGLAQRQFEAFLAARTEA